MSPRWRAVALLVSSGIVGALVGFFLLGGRGEPEAALAAVVGDPLPLVPVATGSLDDSVTLPEPPLTASAASVVAVDPVTSPNPEVAASDRTTGLMEVTLPDGTSVPLADFLFGALEPGVEFRIIDPCAGETPGAGFGEGCEGVGGTILGYVAPGPFRITRVTTASLPGADPAYDLCRMHYGTPGPNELNLAIYSTIPGAFEITGWASWVEQQSDPGGSGTSVQFPAMSRFGPIATSTATAQEEAWRAEQGTPRPNPGVVTCRRISGVGPTGSRIHVRIGGTSIFGSTASAEFDLTHTAAGLVPPTIVTGAQELRLRAMIPARQGETTQLAVFPNPGLRASPGDDTRVNEVCGAGARSDIPVEGWTDIGGGRGGGPQAFDIRALGVVMGWDPAWTRYDLHQALLPGTGAYVACASRRDAAGTLLEWSGFSVLTPVFSELHLDVAAISDAVGRLHTGTITIRSGSNECQAYGTEIRVGRDLCVVARTRPEVPIALGASSGRSIDQVSLEAPALDCADRYWQCAGRSHGVQLTLGPDPASSIQVWIREVMPVYQSGFSGVSDHRRWTIQPTGSQLALGLGSILPPGPPVLTAVSLGPGSGDGPRLSLRIAATRPVRATATVEHLTAPGCRAPDLGGVHGEYAGGQDFTLDLPVSCAGAQYALRLLITDSEGRSSIYSDVDPEAVGPAVVGVSSTRTTQARVRANLDLGVGGRPMHLAAASIMIEGRVVWNLPLNDGRSTRRCVSSEPFGMDAPAVFQAADTWRLDIEVELVPYTNCSAGTGRGVPFQRRLQTMVPDDLRLPAGIGTSGGPSVQLFATLFRF